LPNAAAIPSSNRERTAPRTAVATPNSIAKRARSLHTYSRIADASLRRPPSTSARSPAASAPLCIACEIPSPVA